eukprot:m51a1_g7637 hypothetical protein (136) ;mRNA; r:336639-337167
MLGSEQHNVEMSPTADAPGTPKTPIIASERVSLPSPLRKASFPSRRRMSLDAARPFVHRFKKRLAVSAAAVLIGVALVVAGLVQLGRRAPVARVAPFVVIGVLVALPGVYEAVVLCVTFRRSLVARRVDPVPDFA